MALRRPYYGWLLVVTLGVTETISWGVLYYSFGVFLLPMQAELGWSRADASAAFSLALMLSGLAAFPVGRWLDRHGPRLLMTAGACAATLLVLAWSAVHSLLAFYLVWAAIGLAMAAVLYQPALVVVATWFVRLRPRALTAMTLMAGFASVIFVPLAGWLVQAQGWRPALVTLALVLGAGTILPHALVLRRRPEDLGLAPDGAPLNSPTPRSPAALSAAPPLAHTLRLPTFRWLALGFCLAGFADAALSVHLVPYLSGAGYDPRFAATAAGLIGAAALLGRLLFAPFGDRLPEHVVTALIFLCQTLALLALLLVPALPGVLAFVLLFGAGRGASTLARANLVATLYGRAQYGAISGLLALFVTSAQALAPLAAGLGFDAFHHYEPLLWALAAIPIAAAAAILRTGRAPRESPCSRASHAASRTREIA